MSRSCPRSRKLLFAVWVWRERSRVLGRTIVLWQGKRLSEQNQVLEDPSLPAGSRTSTIGRFSLQAYAIQYGINQLHRFADIENEHRQRANPMCAIEQSQTGPFVMCFSSQPDGYTDSSSSVNPASRRLSRREWSSRSMSRFRQMSAVAAFLFLFAALPALATTTGGTCPSGANYLNTATGNLVTLSSLGVTSCFYVAANGSDTNSGTSEASPFLHSPGMKNCSAATARPFHLRPG